MAYPDRGEIRSLCTEQSFDRGVDYWQRGRIEELDVDDGSIRATVRGSTDYAVSIDVEREAIRTRCSCPYDYAGDCKHIVAVLLAVDEQDAGALEESTEARHGTVDVDALVERPSAEELRTFLLTALEDDRDLRDRFVAFVGEDAGKTVYDYKREIGRLFENAAGRGGFVEYGTWIDFSKYDELAETHRERGDADTATDIYRALAEAIRENLDRVDDSGGHYGQELKLAIEAYAETLVEHGLDHDRKRPHIDYLVREFLEAEYGFVSDAYDDALRTLCTTDADHAYWLARLDERVPGVALEPAALERAADGRSSDHESTPPDERTDAVLYTSDFTDGLLIVEEFTGGTLDVAHPGVGPLSLEYFVGDAFDELRVDERTTVEAHTLEVDGATSDATESAIASSLRTRGVLSTTIYLLEELDEQEALSGLYEASYLESSRFCRQYAERLLERGDDRRAIEVLEDGIETFRSPKTLRWLVAELYEGREPKRYRETLHRLFLEHGEWAAYDDLKAACGDSEWASRYEEFEREFRETDRRRLLAMYVREDELRKAFDELQASEDLSLVRRYRDPVAAVDPAAYFEFYRELLVPFAGGETGRRHYRTIVDHLNEMQELVPEERFEEFVDQLKETHSNRPAFLDELETAGF